VHPSVFAFSLVASLITGALFGLGPSVLYSRFDCTQALKGGAESIVWSFSRVRRTHALGLLVTVQIGIAMMLLVGGGLLMHSFVRLSNVHLGYEPANVLTFQLALPVERMPVVQLKAFAEEVTARLQSMPAVQAAAYTYQLPTVAIRRNAMFRRTPELPRQTSLLPERGASAHLVSRDYFQVMGIRLRAGRGFEERDGAHQPRVVVINQELARLNFRGENPIGTTVYVGPNRDPWEVVGIVDDVRQARLDQNPEPQVFVDFRQWPGIENPLFDAPQYFAVRTHGAPGSVVADVRGVIRQVDARAGLFNIATMEQLVSNSVSRPRMYAVLLGVFAGVAMMLAAVGIYGVVTYAVAQRTREIGIRVALGAQHSEVVHLVLRRGLALTAAGMVLGLMGAAAVTRYLVGMLFDLTPLDATTFLMVSLMFALVATLASYVPARRATKVDPLITLRAE
jgi:predicted permease